MTSIFPDYVSINNQFANTVITQHPEWTVIRNPLDWNCRISMPAHPNQLRVSVATLPLPNNDLFENIFGARGGFGGGGNPFGRATRVRRGKDRVEEIPIELEDLYNNTVKKIDIKQKVLCLDCNGSGAKNSSFIKECSACGGKGMVMRIINMGPMIQQTTSMCDKCSGKGKLIDGWG